MSNLTVSADVDAFMGSADEAAMRTNLGLGTAAVEAATAFATAAQGELADSAVQPGDLGSTVVAADLTGYTAATDWASGDLLYMLKDPAGTPLSRKITLDNIFGAIPSALPICWNADTFLRRDAANTVALRNSTTAQSLLVYNTWSSSGSVYERGFFRWSGNALQIGTEHAGASSRSISMMAEYFVFQAGGTNAVAIISSAMYSVGAGLTSLGTASSPFANLFFKPASSVSLSHNGSVTFEFTSNTTLTIKGRGSDGTTRSVALTLA